MTSPLRYSFFPPLAFIQHAPGGLPAGPASTDSTHQGVPKHMSQHWACTCRQAGRSERVRGARRHGRTDGWMDGSMDRRVNLLKPRVMHAALHTCTLIHARTATAMHVASTIIAPSK